MQDNQIKPKVIIIDDEDALRLGVKKLLELEGYDVTDAPNGTIGLELGCKTDFDLAIIDLKMPDIDGITVLKGIREKQPNTVCFIATAFASYDSAVQATKIGAHGYIPKPFSADELLQQLRLGLERRNLILEAERLKKDREDRLLELSFERSRLNTIINSIDDGVLVVNRDARVVYFNSAALKALNLQEIYLGENIKDVLPDKIKSLISNHLNSENDVEKSYSEEISLSSNNDLIMQATTTPVIQGDGKLAGVVLVLKNITEFKRIEAVKSQFVSMVAHELKAPLAATIGFINLLLQTDIKLSDEQREDFLNRSSRRLNALLIMVNDLLDISRIEMQAVVREIKELSLPDVINDVLQMLQMEIEKKGLSVEIVIEENTPKLKADLSEITRLVTNLISNAIKYNKQNGQIAISVNSAQHYLTLIVADTGIGMKEKEKKRLFQDFFRAKNEHTKNIHGTGLGLAIVKRIVETYNGTVEVESEYGEGTTFFVKMPLLLHDDAVIIIEKTE